ncbi:MAG: hypothetical protein ACKVTZ_09180 [Bacteroidia bacterium]
MEKIVKRIYIGAGIYGLLVLIPQLFVGEGMIATDAPPALNHTEFFYAFNWLAIAWQITFFLIAQDPKRYRAIMFGTVLEKAGFGFLTVYYHFFKSISPSLLLGGIIDLCLMCAFIFCILKTENSEK